MYTRLANGSYRLMKPEEKQTISSYKDAEVREADFLLKVPARKSKCFQVLPPAVVSSESGNPEFPFAFGWRCGELIPSGLARGVTHDDVTKLLAFASKFDFGAEVLAFARTLASEKVAERDLATFQRFVPFVSPAEASPELTEAQVGTRVMLAPRTIAELLRAQDGRQSWWQLALTIVRSTAPRWASVREQMVVIVPQPATGAEIAVVGTNLSASMEALASEVKGVVRTVRVPDQRTFDAACAAGVTGVVIGGKVERGELRVTHKTKYIPRNNPWLGMYFGRSLLAY